MVRFYGYTVPEFKESSLLIDIQLDPKDPLLEAKQRLFNFAFIKNSSSEVDFGYRFNTPRSEMMLHKIITPFRINAWTHGKAYIETVRSFLFLIFSSLLIFKTIKILFFLILNCLSIRL